MPNLDCIIVGQGIAGSNLAFELLKRGKSLRIIDASWKSAACLVAAGVINPITGQRLVKSWKSGQAHPYAKKFYAALEGELGCSFYHDRKILQLCKSAEEHQLWQKRLQDPEYAPFIGAHVDCESQSSYKSLNAKFGYHFIERSAWVEPAAIMPAYKRYFLRRGVLEESQFDFARLSLHSDCVSYGDIRAQAAIFCDGAAAVGNPYFSWLPYRCAKGEILQIASDAEIPEHIIHRGNWLMKCADGEFRIGSTWDRENLDEIPTQKARTELLAAAATIIKTSQFEVLRQSAGVRPCTATTRPHLGRHPKFPRVLSFNGFGSKGFALTPFFAAHFADYLYGFGALDPEADLKRHVKKFYR